MCLFIQLHWLHHHHPIKVRSTICYKPITSLDFDFSNQCQRRERRVALTRGGYAPYDHTTYGQDPSQMRNFSKQRWIEALSGDKKGVNKKPHEKCHDSRLKNRSKTPLNVLGENNRGNFQCTSDAYTKKETYFSEYVQK